TAQFLGSPLFDGQPATTLNQIVASAAEPGPQGPVITSSPPPDAAWRRRYRHQITTAGTHRPRMRIVAGALPPGLSLKPKQGTISGVPVRAGSYAFTVEVIDRSGATTRAAYTITVSRPAPAAKRPEHGKPGPRFL